MSSANDSPAESSTMSSSQSNSAAMVLSIRTLEHQTKPVTISRDASVLDLKHAVQGAFQIDSNRQRLIFQGKMMKDGQSLTEYANLDTGKVVHLVVRPPDVPRNPQNDEPRPQTNRRSFPRGMPPPRFLSSRSPIVEGYTLITLDVGERPSSPLSSLLGSFTGPLFPEPEARTPSDNARQTSNSQSQDTTTQPPFSIPGRPSSFDFNLRSRNPLTDLGFSSASSSPSGTRSTTPSSNTQLPASVEVRLMRTMSCIRNVRTILEAPTDQSVPGIFTTATAPSDQSDEIHALLQRHGTSQSAAVGMVLDELANLMSDTVPRLQEVSQNLRTADQQENTTNGGMDRRMLRTARIVQGMSLISHFLGSVLAAAEVSPRSRGARTRMSGTTAATASSLRRRANSLSATSPITNTTPRPSTTRRNNNRETTQPSSSAAASSSTPTETRGSKRERNDNQDHDEESSRQSKGKKRQNNSDDDNQG
ncbi:hypothetical protein RO3G_09253 [Lichtheimia corymbifera JMRC:FSU:9682]|uniref:Ubiquitin-like domain-containing protein n=1 Tax=Lichtheimia corymbifera JMRC:FSU:9682 TaxID=1263082 RepID=A0A068RUA7_9FUNG|nr:hypothetical protein RO3G_09253 [Lichtheimia corymbifera JMRC:FSU:9682]